MQLPRGITGIDANSGVDVCAFRTVLYTSAREAGFTVDQPPPDRPELTNNFVQAFVSFRSVRWRLLLNIHHPYVGFTTPVTSVGSYDFLDCDQLATNWFGYTVLSAATLNSPVTESAISLLSENERQEIRCWEVQTLGELIFNFWD